MKKYVCFCAILLASSCSLHADAVVLDSLPFAMPEFKAPEFPNRTFLITDYGAVSDGQTKNTEAIAKTIGACAKAGGGTVVVPAGFWMTGPILLKSNVNLHLDKGAIIVFSSAIEDYPMVQRTFEGLESIRRQSPISGGNLENIAITGDGVIDGSGGVWRPVKKYKLRESDWRKLVSSGGAVDEAADIWWPSQAALNGAKTVAELKNRQAPVAEYIQAAEYLRPVMVSLVSCKNVLLDGPTFQNSPAWNIHPLMCENMTIRNITVRNPWFSQNGDGLDLESCKNVVVHNCSFDVGDDAMCMKSGKDEYGRQRGIPTENVAIWDCTVYHGHGG
ncbi:MAG: glycoside hydrolase family 28 protein, partial [Planctomycetota bacterium]